MECELCGVRSSSRKAEIEGVVLNVCERCVKYGKEIVIQRPNSEKKELSRTLPEIKKIPVEDFSEKVRKLREERKLSQEELAKSIKEKVSVIKRIEDGWIPEEKVIEKLERFFGVKLTEEVMEKEFKPHRESKNTPALTIGDIVEIK